MKPVESQNYNSPYSMMNKSDFVARVAAYRAGLPFEHAVDAPADFILAWLAAVSADRPAAR